MLNILSITVQVLVSIMMYVIAYKNISPYKFRLRDYVYMIVAIVIVYNLLYALNMNLESIAIYGIPVVFIYMKSKTFVKSIILNIFICLIIIFNSSLIGLIGVSVLQYNIAQYTTGYYIISIIMYISLFIISRVVGKLYERYRYVFASNSKYTILISATLILIFFVFYIDINWNTSKDTSYLTSVNSFMFIIYFIILIFICGTLVFFISKEMKLKYKQIQFEELQEYTNNLESLYMDMQKFRHDYINILSSISAFLDEKDIEGLEKYFYKHIYILDKSMEKNNSKLGLLRNIKILEIKGLLYTKLIRAEALELDVNIDIVEPIIEIKMNIIDLVRVLGILLDNAIEAALESDEKRVEIAIIKKQDSIIIPIINSYKRDIPPIYKMFGEGFSTKGENRGIGLSNMKIIIDQYKNITLDTSIEDKSFIQCLDINSKAN